MVRLRLLITACVVIVSFSQAFETECDPARPPSAKQSLPDEIKFRDAYKVSGIISNWVEKTTAAFSELANSDGISITVSSRNESLHWLTVKNEGTFLHNKTAAHCGVSVTAPLAAFPQLSTISPNLNSFSTFVAGLLEFSRNSTGEVRDNPVVAGLEGVRWVSCRNATNGTANLQLEVIYAGEKGSLQPPSKEFNNPLVLSVRISEYGNFSDNSTLKSKLSVEFDQYDVPSAEYSSLLMIPTGTVCEGWKEAAIPLNVSDPFSVLIETVDEKKSKQETMVYYSPKEQLAVVSGSKQGDSFPFFKEKNVADGVSSVVHDFKRGYEYALNQRGCVNLVALPSDSADVKSSDGALSMRSVTELLVTPELKFGKYGQIKADDGREHDIYRAVDNKTQDIVELHFDGDQLISSSIYKLLDGQPNLSSYTKYSHVPSAVPSQLDEYMRSCFAMFSSEFPDNNTFIFEVKSRSVKDVYSQGVEAVTSSLADALSQVAPINPLRVRAFYDSGSDKSLRVFFSVDEKPSVAPAVVPTYNFTAEVSSSELLKKLNETISQGDWKFSVMSSEKKSEDWVVTAHSLKRYSAPAEKHEYSGYTGGAMFVLGVFSLVIGVAIGAGGVFFATKRQRISTLAYQVFE
ncbi:hypothetical protein Q1695_008723 [Nippostrongylus brasiliensis]|nr:hypothetical protein Q1695_008723 [Nippostrongylus brasiliensis]